MKRNAFFLTGIVLVSMILAVAFPGLATPGPYGGPYPLGLYLPFVGGKSQPPYPYPYPEPTFAPTPVPFEVLKLWTMNGSLAPQVAFHPGEVINLVADYFSAQSNTAVIFYWNLSPRVCGTMVDIRQSLTLQSGYASTYKRTTIPTNACAGKYAIRFRAIVDGQNYEEQIEIQIR